MTVREGAIGVVLMAHGTRSQAGLAETRRLADAVANLLPEHRCELGFIELAEPTLDEALASASAGATKVVAVPLVLWDAGHMKSDCAGAVARSRQGHKTTEIIYARGIGTHPTILGLLASRARQALSRLEGEGRQAVVLVGRGSSDPDANAEMFRVARLAEEPFSLPNTEAAFVSLASPGVPEALSRAAALGAREIAVVPYFLFDGLLVGRIREQALRWAEQAGVRVEVAAHLGPEAEVAEVVVERLEQALAGGLDPLCDLCAFRVPLPGQGHLHHAPLPVLGGGHSH